MTRIFFLTLWLMASLAAAQTYIRPSKGVPLTPFSTAPAAGWSGWPTISGAGTIGVTTEVYSSVWDWSAFEAMRIRIYSTGSGTNGSGLTCSRQALQYTVDGIGAYARIKLFKVASGSFFVVVQDSANASGPFYTVQSTNSTIASAIFTGCPTYIQVTPMPFSSGVVSVANTLVSSDSSDGGVAVTVGTIQVRTQCVTVKMATTQVNTAVLSVPADGGLDSRWYVKTCNSAKNTGIPILTCTSDGQTPTTAASSSGDALEVGDCAVYYTGTPIRCISDTTATQVTTEECL